METKQVELWKSDFGLEYSKRDENQVSSDDQRRLFKNWGVMLRNACSPVPRSVLEVGSNIGRNLHVLKHMIDDVHAIEPNAKCCDIMKNNKLLEGVSINEASAFNIPYDDESMDLVFTSGVLIHISPDDLKAAIDEIYRVSRHYILCVEYFSHNPEEVPYHNLSGYLFKRDFGSFYLEHYPKMSVVDYGFLWQRYDACDNCNWWLFKK